MSLRARIQRVLVVLWLVVFTFNISSLSLAQAPQALTISHGKEVSLEYTLRLEDKKIVDTNVAAEPLVFTQGSMQIIPGLEKRLEGMAVGQEKQVVVTPEEGYGPVNPQAIIEVPKEQLPGDSLKVGQVLEGQDPTGKPMYAKVTEIRDKTAILDLNHPLAGQTLYFDVKVLNIKEGGTH
ncbi:peptidylprolyl isomerase [Candidatus Nitronereus thalassa]|uniref:Peptidyl-prolyl cis-trans isomerase n=1 Tax=Candidatus Nitronereus thalassa TaxID=3020898 RepID=A0ABU3KCX6_9BACT|nr:peptidylprolyl isomerase [Candidatus Nitronereus thalassa]MDT7044287.1 peptidylprolyl isomerase [Candidatus Nitronereus thalassa]